MGANKQKTLKFHGILTSLTIDDRFEVSAKEIVNLSGVTNLDTVYSILKEAVDKLNLRKVIICDPDPNNPKEKPDQ
jgi:hypothetical protein